MCHTTTQSKLFAALTDPEARRCCRACRVGFNVSVHSCRQLGRADSQVPGPTSCEYCCVPRDIPPSAPQLAGCSAPPPLSLQCGLEVGGVYTLVNVIPKNPPVGCAAACTCVDSALCSTMFWCFRCTRLAMHEQATVEQPSASSSCCLSCLAALACAAEEPAGQVSSGRPAREAGARLWDRQTELAANSKLARMH